jgi:hypothetical protein
MQIDEEPRLEDVIADIAALLAVAYRRRAKIRLVPTALTTIQSTEGLETIAETSVHELTLTGQRKDPIQE